MNAQRNDIEAIYNAALSKKGGTERSAYLDSACGGDSALRARVDVLLKAHDRVGEFLEIPPPFVDAPVLDESLTEGPGTVIGRYKLLEKIGEGGMAIVYMAEQQEPIRRKVALKIIKLGMDTRQVIARFEVERQALAMMDHPNIAKVLDAGATETGRPYFVMELVKGVSITEYCDRNNLSTKERLDLFIQVCNAVQHAHQKGIIHRDIKPSNVMVTHHDGKAVPKVIDFGIAKAINQRLTEKTLFTRYAHIIGTPAYMSPEQAELSDLDIDTRTDIYSLGVLLYELLTGTTPFSEEELRKAGYIEMQRVIREEEPVKPSTKLSTLGETLTEVAKRHSATPDVLRKAVRGDLDWIVMKSLEKDRTRRYETPNSLMQDLERHLNNEPVLARPPGTAYRFQKLVRRNKAIFVPVVAVAAALVIGLMVSVVSLVREQRARRIAVTAQEREAALRYASDMSLAQQALAMNDLGRARRLLDAHRPAPSQVDLRGWEWRYLWQECQSDARSGLCRYPNSAYSVAYSPDGKMLAVAGIIRGFVEIWDVANRRRIKTLDPNEGRLVAFSPRGDWLATDASEKQIRLWRTGTWELAAPLTLAGSALVLKFSPDGTRLASLGTPDEVTVWEVDQWTTVRQIRGARHMGSYIGAIDFSPDSRALAIGDADHRLRVVNLASGATEVNVPQAHSEGISAVAWSPTGSIIASGSGYVGGPIRLWDAASGRLLGELPGHTSWICELIFAADGQRLYSASADQTIRIWDVGERRCLATLRGSRDEVQGLALSPDGTTLASASRDGVVAFWDAEPRFEEEWPRLIALGQWSWSAFAPDSRVLAVPHAGTVRLLDLATLREVEQIPALGPDIVTVSYSPDGTLLVGRTPGGKLRVWSCTEHRLLREVGDPNTLLLLWAGGFRADGKRFLSVDGKGKASWWDTLTWQVIRAFRVETKSATWPALSPDGCLLGIGTQTGAVHWLNAETGELLAATSAAHRHLVGGLAFSADGTRAASVAQEGTVALWDPSSLQLIVSFKGHMQGAHGVAFSPEGRRLATSGGGREAVKLWDMATYRDLITLSGQGSVFSFVAFSPDGKWLIACNGEGHLHLWHAPSWEEIEAAERQKGSYEPER
jgi:WD40 repeat protein/serine/threonine protein kinase